LVKGRSAWSRLKFASHFEPDVNDFPCPKTKPGPLKDPISTRKFLLFRGANPAAGYKVVKNEDCSCFATMGLKTNAFDSNGSGKRKCLSLIRLVFQQ